MTSGKGHAIKVFVVWLVAIIFFYLSPNISIIVLNEGDYQIQGIKGILHCKLYWYTMFYKHALSFVGLKT